MNNTRYRRTQKSHHEDIPIRDLEAYAAVAGVTDVPIFAMQEKTRQRRVAMAREIYYGVLRRHNRDRISLIAMSGYINQDHSTAYSAANRFEESMLLPDKDSVKIQFQYNEIIKTLKKWKQE